MPRGGTWIKTKCAPRKNMVTAMTATAERCNNNHNHNKRAKRRGQKERPRDLDYSKTLMKKLNSQYIGVANMD